MLEWRLGTKGKGLLMMRWRCCWFGLVLAWLFFLSFPFLIIQLQLSFHLSKSNKGLGEKKFSLAFRSHSFKKSKDGSLAKTHSTQLTFGQKRPKSSKMLSYKSPRKKEEKRQPTEQRNMTQVKEMK